MISWDDVTAIATELEGFNSDAQQLILDFVNEMFDASLFKPTQLKLARIYLAAHLATMSGQGGDMTAGPVISETVGGITRAYANVATGGQFVGSSYADALQLLLNTSCARLPRVI